MGSWHVDGDRRVVQWEKVYNTVRPHQALGYLTPQEYITQWQNNQARKEAL